MTYAPMLKKEEGQLDFTHPAEELERRVRAFNPWPGAFMDFEGTLLKVHRAHVEQGKGRGGAEANLSGSTCGRRRRTGFSSWMRCSPPGKSP